MKIEISQFFMEILRFKILVGEGNALDKLITVAFLGMTVN